MELFLALKAGILTVSTECLNLHSGSGKCMQQVYNKRAKVSDGWQVQKLRAKNGTVGHCFQVWKLCTARTCQARENRSSVYMLENVQSVPGVGVYLCVESGNKIEAFIYILKARIRVSKKKARKIKVITLILSYLCVQTCFSECQEPSLNNTVRKKLIVLIA